MTKRGEDDRSEHTVTGLRSMESPHDLSSIERSTRNLIITDPDRLEELENQRNVFHKTDFNASKVQRGPLVVAFKHHPVV